MDLMQETLVAIKEHPLKLTGRLHIKVTDVETGEVVQDIKVPNLVVTAGKELLANILAGRSPIPTKMSIGTDSTAADVAQTELLAPVFTDDMTQAEPDGTSIIYYFFVDSITANGVALREAGIFNSEGTMLARTTFPSVTKTVGTALTISWTITFN